MNSIDPQRIHLLNDRPVREKGDYVLYWMTAARRTEYNFGLQRAIDWANRLARPLLILEALRLDYPWASRRLHAFILQGMADNQAALADRPVGYFPFVETEPGQGKGLLAALAQTACLTVCDYYPCFFIPRMLAAAAGKSPVRLEAVDSCGLIPLARPDKEYLRAFDFRRRLQRDLPGLLSRGPASDPLAGLEAEGKPTLPRSVIERWPEADPALLRADPAALSGLAVDQSVREVNRRGGSRAAEQTLAAFLDQGLDHYEQARHPAAGAVSRLSAYLHFGHISTHQIFEAATGREDWSPDRLPESASGKSAGWLGLSPPVEAFLDQVLTWRELGHVFCHHRPDYDRYSSLPDWARQTLADHAGDRRPYLYAKAQFDRAETHDELWNAAQRQLVRKGTIETYLRMLWGKKIFHWSADPEQALEIMIELNDRYALDGRDPNSYSGIFWILGRFDRAWGPERAVFGKVRYMRSANTMRKLNLGDYLDRFGPD